jgi:hypothetical protein
LNTRGCNCLGAGVGVVAMRHLDIVSWIAVRTYWSGGNSPKIWTAFWPSFVRQLFLSQVEWFKRDRQPEKHCALRLKYIARGGAQIPECPHIRVISHACSLHSLRFPRPASLSGCWYRGSWGLPLPSCACYTPYFSSSSPPPSVTHHLPRPRSIANAH